MPSDSFIEETRKMSTGMIAQVNSEMVRARILQMVAPGMSNVKTETDRTELHVGRVLVVPYVHDREEESELKM